MDSGNPQQLTLDGLQRLATEYRRNAQRCHEIASFLVRQNGSLFWQSQAAKSFKEHIAESIAKLKEFQTDFIELGQNIDRRIATLERSGNL